MSLLQPTTHEDRGRQPSDTHQKRAPFSPITLIGEEERGHEQSDAHMERAPSSLLQIYADSYESAQKRRMALMNQMRCWIRDTLPRDQWEGVDFSDEALNDKVLVSRLPNDMRPFVEEIQKFEDSAARYLRREIRKHPLWPWMEAQRGIGEVLAGRLLARIHLERFPAPSHLWSYCGLDGPGWKALGEDGKKRYSRRLNTMCWQIGSSFKHQPAFSGGYRDVYDRRKAYELSRPWCGQCNNRCPACVKTRAKKCDPSHHGEGRVHCTAGHCDNKAARYAVKEFLKDLWVYHARIGPYYF